MEQLAQNRQDGVPPTVAAIVNDGPTIATSEAPPQMPMVTQDQLLEFQQVGVDLNLTLPEMIVSTSTDYDINVAWAGVDELQPSLAVPRTGDAVCQFCNMAYVPTLDHDCSVAGTILAGTIREVYLA